MKRRRVALYGAFDVARRDECRRQIDITVDEIGLELDGVSIAVERELKLASLFVDVSQIRVGFGEKRIRSYRQFRKEGRSFVCGRKEKTRVVAVLGGEMMIARFRAVTCRVDGTGSEWRRGEGDRRCSLDRDSKGPCRATSSVRSFRFGIRDVRFREGRLGKRKRPTL